MDIVDFFDVNNLDHLRAYKYLCDVGMWPEGFVPAEVTIRAKVGPWQVALLAKMADAYIEEKLK